MCTFPNLADFPGGDAGDALASRLDAIASLERALRLDPQHWRAATNLASCLLQCERFDDAVAPAQLAATGDVAMWVDVIAEAQCLAGAPSRVCA